mmetsp:Transcript_46337/g.99225  ORF Transcript_46337/g.99225 Transcript_46337/m.99225 type:complete len:251 (-) Transcript_46337:1311-2063(-)
MTKSDTSKSPSRTRSCSTNWISWTNSRWLRSTAESDPTTPRPLLSARSRVWSTALSSQTSVRSTSKPLRLRQRGMAAMGAMEVMEGMGTATATSVAMIATVMDMEVTAAVDMAIAVRIVKRIMAVATRTATFTATDPGTTQRSVALASSGRTAKWSRWPSLDGSASSPRSPRNRASSTARRAFWPLQGRPRSSFSTLWRTSRRRRRVRTGATTSSEAARSSSSGKSSTERRSKRGLCHCFSLCRKNCDPP